MGEPPTALPHKKIPKNLNKIACQAPKPPNSLKPNHIRVAF